MNVAIPEERRRKIEPIENGAAPYIEIAGERFINFTANNYLSLATHPEVVESAVRALREDGAGAGSSRLISGSSRRVAILEERLAAFKSAARSIVTTSGFSASMTALGGLAGREDGIALEKGAHASLVTGSRLAGARLGVFRRAEPESLRRALRHLREAKNAARLLVVFDGVHSMDGDIVALPEILSIAREHGATMVIDDAHATGVIGSGGRGTFDHFGIAPATDVVQIGTLSKAFGCQGGFVAGSADVIERIIQSSSALIYTTALLPAAVGAALGALDVIEREPERLERLSRVSRAFRRMVGASDIPSPIIPLVVGSDGAALEWRKKFRAAGALTAAIRPPTVPEGTARLRFSLQSDHRILVEGADHAPEERYLVLARTCAAEQVANPA